MNEFSVAEAKNRLSELLTRVEAGEDISVTRRGKRVARLVAIEADADSNESRRARVLRALDRLAALRRGVRLEGDTKLIAREGLD